MSLEQVALEALNRRGTTFIIRIKQELKASGKSATGSLIQNTTGSARIEGTRVVFEALAPEHYVFVDKGRRPGAKAPPIKAIKRWISQKGLDLNAYAVAKSISKKGIKATNIYTGAIRDFKRELSFETELSREIINELKFK